MAVIKFTATSLAGLSKRGVLKPDSDGYYTMPIGGLNVVNSVGQVYVANGARELFESSSIFMRRVKNGNLKGENGHPKRLPGMSVDDYMNRALSIEETNVCVHFKEIWLDEDFGKKNPEYKQPDMIAIMAKLTPSGEKGPALKAALYNPDENVNFSIRALTRDYMERGVCHRVLTNILCWDWVTEPGLALANKWKSPALESLQEEMITVNQLEHMLHDNHSLATESSKQFVSESLKVFKTFEPIKTSRPKYLGW